ncbi:CHAD domain-containing protein [Nocardia miyunensis]|uniref:CHAD domain-containing protein n=1 Tax=Nocardia miyunensis TaxID=282684 RepID=UPI000834ECF3|nr:CHAD domain-containing protein [Nocardia miyunensis]
MADTAGSALTTVLDDDVERLLRAEPAVRRDAPDSVHAMRVATRRLRSVLRSYRRLLEPGRVREIRDELRWLAGILGVARDAEVRGDRFAALLEEYRGDSDADNPDDPAEALRSTVAELVDNERTAYAAAYAVVLVELDDDRYANLRQALLDLRSAPPLVARRAEAEASRAFGKVLRADFDELHLMVDREITMRADPAISEDERIEHLHEIRKSAKRLRYCSEAAADVLGGPAAELALRAKKLQTVLGDHRDAVEAMAAIRTAAAHTGNPDTSPFDRLYESEAAAARKALEQYSAAADFARQRDRN